ncbi:MAG: ATP-binding protein [Ignavibacteria bacterium]|nr:ATP-binding protein [Ignavibacteria bacterium]
MKKFLQIKIKYLVIISLTISALMIFSSIFEYLQNKKEIYHLINDNATSLLQTISSSSANTIISDREFEALITQHLLGVAKNVARLDNMITLNKELLREIAEENDVYRINIFNQRGEKILSNAEDTVHKGLKPKHSPKEFIKPILEGKESEIIIGIKESRFEEGERYAVAVRRYKKEGGAIVVNLDVELIKEFQAKTGFGKMIQDIGNKEEVEYIILQDKDEIIAANKEIKDFKKIDQDEFLFSVYNDTITKSRELYYGGKKIFEVAKKFQIGNQNIGIFRVGLKLDEIDSLEARLIRRTIIITLIIIVISIILITIIVANQNYKLLSDEYKKIQVFTSTILENMTLSVIAIGKNDNIIIFNKYSEKIFNCKSNNVLEKNYENILKNYSTELVEIFKNKIEYSDKEISINVPQEGKKILLINSTKILDDKGEPYIFTVVSRDITELKILQEQKIRNERLITMGELASAVAHEVRNPLNSINMIAQRFEKAEDKNNISKEEYKKLIKVLKSESERVNNIIIEFLKFSKPKKPELQPIKVSEFLTEIKNLLEVLVQGRKIKIEINKKNDSIIDIDPELFKQVFNNLAINSIDSIQKEGKIEINFYVSNNRKIFEFIDTGTGIPDEIKDKIFYPYFTTKKSGSGLGLSVVQQIVTQHNGIIYFESKINFGTKFTIELR